jgi:hypothetical protein
VQTNKVAFPKTDRGDKHILMLNRQTVGNQCKEDTRTGLVQNTLFLRELLKICIFCSFFYIKMGEIEHMKIEKEQYSEQTLKNYVKNFTKSCMVELLSRGETISSKWWNRFHICNKPSLFPIHSDMQGALLLK